MKSRANLIMLCIAREKRAAIVKRAVTPHNNQLVMTAQPLWRPVRPLMWLNWCCPPCLSNVEVGTFYTEHNCSTS